MYQIDFLPEEYRHQRTARRQQFRRLVLLAVAAGGLMSVSFLLHIRRVQLQQELDLVEPVHSALCAQTKQWNTLQTHLQSVRAMAELLAYLRHPWPRTQILTQLVEPLPESLIVEQISIDRQTPENQPPPRPMSRNEQEAEKARLAAMPPATRDRRRFQQECDPMQTIVRLGGRALDAAALHQYLAALEKSQLFHKVHLVNLEKSGDREGLQFQVRLIVRPGYGQAGGPKTSESPSAVSGPPASPIPPHNQTHSPAQPPSEYPHSLFPPDPLQANKTFQIPNHRGSLEKSLPPQREGRWLTSLAPGDSEGHSGTVYGKRPFWSAFPMFWMDGSFVTGRPEKPSVGNDRSIPVFLDQFSHSTRTL